MALAKLFKNTVLYSIGEILPRAISLLLLPIYTRYLSPADYGITSYIHTIIIFLYVLGAFGLNTYVLRFYFIHEEEKERRILLGTAQLTIAGLNILILSLAFLMMPLIIDKYQIQVPWNPYFRLAFIINFLECLSIIPLVIYRVRQDALKFVALGFSRTVLTVLLTLFFVVYQKKGLIGTFNAQLYVLIPYSFVYLGIMQKYASWQIKWSFLKEGLKFAAPLIPGAICYQMLSVSDRIIMERYVGMDEIGIYNVAFQMALVLNIIIQSGYRAIEPELFRRYGKEGFFDFIQKTQNIFFSIIYIGALAICLFSQEVFKLMTTEGFHHGYLLVPVLILGVIMTGQNVIYGGILQGEKRTEVQGTATFIGAIVSILFNLLLIPIFGIYAAAAASAISFFVMNMILFCEMTLPGKKMYRELLLVLLVPGISYLLFGYFDKVSVMGMIVKTIVVLSYGYFTIKLLRVDLVHAHFLIQKKHKS